MARPGDVVTVDFSGATGTKRRPAVVVSSDQYHAERPDLILGVLTTNLASARASTDYHLQDWAAAGLRNPSAFRAYFGMSLPTSVQIIGRLSDRDWQAVRDHVHRAFAAVASPVAPKPAAGLTHAPAPPPPPLPPPPPPAKT